MTEIVYQDLPWPVREDITAAQARTWEKLAQPGTWLSGAERLAIAAEARHAQDCQLCWERKDALSPEAVRGSHDTLSQLSALEVEQIHRIRTDPGRLSRAWFLGLLEAGMVED
ncbi:MAG: alkylhydroperoxidase-related (seleno)protein, partial [Alphaproteobacteria bacterium]|nr:alkylhydroperoxidase-related (seleno)protein [Alphaproteobacteria bacterium]